MGGGGNCHRVHRLPAEVDCLRRRQRLELTGTLPLQVRLMLCGGEEPWKKGHG